MDNETNRRYTLIEIMFKGIPKMKKPTLEKIYKILQTINTDNHIIIQQTSTIITMIELIDERVTKLEQQMIYEVKKKN